MKQKIMIGVISLVVIGVIANFLLNEQTKTGITSEGTGSQVGDTPPQFKLENFQQEVVGLEQFKGKKLIVNFWASWCLPCRKEMPLFQAISDAREDVVVLAVNMSHKDSSPQKVETFLNDNDLTFPAVLDVDGAVSKAYSIINIPTTFFINEDGTIFQRVDGEVNEAQIMSAIEAM